MKKLKLLLIYIAIFLTAQAFAQKIQASTYIEKTHISPKMGTTLGYLFPCNIEVGGFYQNATEDVPTRENGHRIYEEEFYGAYLNYPMASMQKAHLNLNIRTGVSNGQNFVITPSVLANYELLKRLQIGAGMGVRAFRPTLQASIKLNL